jgi:hypothetical protein
MKRLRGATPRIKEMPAPQQLLSSQHNTHRNVNKTAHNSVTGKKRVSRTLSRKFWQQKYFRENLVLARSPLAPENFFRLFANLIRKSDSMLRRVFIAGAATPRTHRRVENEKRNDEKTCSSDACALGIVSLTMFRCRASP